MFQCQELLTFFLGPIPAAGLQGGCGRWSLDLGSTHISQPPSTSVSQRMRANECCSVRPAVHPSSSVRSSNAHAMAPASPPPGSFFLEWGNGDQHAMGAVIFGRDWREYRGREQTPGESEMPELKSHFKSSLGGAAPPVSAPLPHDSQSQSPQISNNKSHNYGAAAVHCLGSVSVLVSVSGAVSISVYSSAWQPKKTQGRDGDAV